MHLFSIRYCVSFCIWPIFGMVFALFILYIVICLPVMLFGCKFYMFPSSDICKTSWANQSWSHMKISIEKSIVQDLRGPISLRAQWGGDIPILGHHMVFQQNFLGNWCWSQLFLILIEIKFSINSFTPKMSINVHVQVPKCTIFAN